MLEKLSLYSEMVTCGKKKYYELFTKPEMLTG